MAKSYTRNLYGNQKTAEDSKVQQGNGLKTLDGRETNGWMKDYFLDGTEMRKVIRNVKSEWIKVTSGILQGSVQAPLLFLVYVSDMMGGINSYINLFADKQNNLGKLEVRMTARNCKLT